ncbi:HD domain-containing phosphohydrolase [Terribacillus sp. 179-K 1B1 HS]|uniref:HD-GYP domain-containing protein n=1 Tax=Terribacillus sp. 179-K 1B1 HS TaxID=3142388 RepID=UPI0039A1D21F
MILKRKRIQDILLGDIMGSDIVLADKTRVEKGTVITAALLDQLKQNRVPSVIVETEEEAAADLFSKSDRLQQMIQALQEKETDHQATYKRSMEKHFYTNLSYIAFEYRYGKLLYEEENIRFLKDLYVKSLKTMGRSSLWHLLEQRDPYAFIHSLDVFVIGTMLAYHMNVVQLDLCATGYLFHDIGKLEIPREILDKTSTLTKEEYEIVQTHTVKGEALLNQAGEPLLGRYARSHHERLNRKGYPDGAYLPELGVDLQILAVVDTFSALTLSRTYREVLPATEAIQLMLEMSEAYPKKIVKKLAQLMHIFPSDMRTVQLDDVMMDEYTNEAHMELGWKQKP